MRAAFLTGPDGTPGPFLVPVWSGDRTAGETRVGHLQRLGTPVFTQVGPMAYSDLLHVNDAQGVRGRHVTARTLSLPRYPPGAIGALIEAAETFSSPLSGAIIQDFHGAAARVPVESTAFGNGPNITRLLAAMRRFDPDGIFSAVPLAVAG